MPTLHELPRKFRELQRTDQSHQDACVALDELITALETALAATGPVEEMVDALITAFYEDGSQGTWAARSALLSAFAALQSRAEAAESSLESANRVIRELSEAGQEQANKLSAAERDRDAAREELAQRDTCIVCGCLLHPPESPPHCEDCVPDDEHQDKWEEMRTPPKDQP